MTAVDDISLQIRHGEILGMVGESGAVRSMTGMSILGLLEPPGRIAAGTTHLSGDRIDKLDDRAMQTVRGSRIGAIFQERLTSFNPLFRGRRPTVRNHSPAYRSRQIQRSRTRQGLSSAV
ncbi:ATP-binding cassette domain-containing protein [Paracoccus sp. Z330]|uniref:ATP-binding cassette domain-containing protein n=1 Tax=Paracoccus onchidii TaxID=3017813 RepID=A0ABT4ZEF1_9RHOB|nr:ATP-binding cassette domain-containing protein [Paracoccus onchidii]MDB6177746.1 ATP-binding cassette domain-containing protein [Paracoccus onchidii]